MVTLTDPWNFLLHWPILKIFFKNYLSGSKKRNRRVVFICTLGYDYLFSKLMWIIKRYIYKFANTTFFPPLYKVHSRLQSQFLLFFVFLSGSVFSVYSLHLIHCSIYLILYLCFSLFVSVIWTSFASHLNQKQHTHIHKVITVVVMVNYYTSTFYPSAFKFVSLLHSHNDVSCTRSCCDHCEQFVVQCLYQGYWNIKKTIKNSTL